MTIADGIARQTAVAIERARLVEESRRLVRAVESTEEAVLITDAKRRVIFANLAFMRTLGYRRDEVIGRDASSSPATSAEPLERVPGDAAAAQLARRDGRAPQGRHARSRSCSTPA